MMQTIKPLVGKANAALEAVMLVVGAFFMTIAVKACG